MARAQGTVAGLTIARELNALVESADEKIKTAIAGVVETRHKALIQFQPGIEEARKELYQKFSESCEESILV